MSEVLRDTYKGFYYQITWTPPGKDRPPRAHLFVEGFRAPPRLLWDSFEDAKQGLEHWADLELAMGRRAM